MIETRDSAVPSWSFDFWTRILVSLTFAGSEVVEVELVSLLGSLQGALVGREVAGRVVGLVVGSAHLDTAVRLINTYGHFLILYILNQSPQHCQNQLQVVLKRSSP